MPAKEEEDGRRKRQRQRQAATKELRREGGQQGLTWERRGGEAWRGVDPSHQSAAAAGREMPHSIFNPGGLDRLTESHFHRIVMLAA